MLIIGIIQSVIIQNSQRKSMMEQTFHLQSLLLSDQDRQQLTKINLPMGAVFPKVGDQTRKVQLSNINKQYADNQIDTTKYNLLTFLPKSLLLQFTRLSNVIFLLTAFLQAVPLLSSLSPFVIIGPLAFVLAISMLREGYEDYKRHKKDWEINSRTTRVLRKNNFVQIEWDQLRPGDYVQILNDQIVPADILLLSSSDQNSVCFVQTANLDGENNLKQKHAFTQTAKMRVHQFESLQGYCLVDAPNPLLYEFEGQIKFEKEQSHFISYQNLILRQTILRNTDYVVGVALFCGYDTKILKNQGQVHHKVSKVQKKLNYIQIALLFLLIAMCGSCGVGYYFIHTNNNLRNQNSYIPSVNLSMLLESSVTTLTIFLLLNFLIPITLNILIEGIKTFSGIFLSVDKKLFDSECNKGCAVLNTSIVEELGSVDIILTDKTGTLTANEMAFKTIAINDKIYCKAFIKENIQHLRLNRQFDQFWIGLIICHDVVKDHRKDVYQGSSPDEVCFINFAHSIGYTFLKRTKNQIEIQVENEKRVYVLLDMINFSSRRRMSVIVKNIRNGNEVIVYTKGADTAIFQKASWLQNSDSFTNHINSFAKNGLRTLVFAKRVITLKDYHLLQRRKQEIWEQFKQRIITKEQCIRIQNQITQQIEDRLSITGASGIEDRLQQDVPQTIARLQRADIRVMMITGDKLQTAQNIGYLSHMIKQNYKVYKLTSNISDLRVKAQTILTEIEQHEAVCIIIQGNQIANILEQKDPYFIDIYASILDKSSSVIFCRSSPKEKASIVRFVKKHMKAVVLAIGDGGNDVGMIEQAHIGVGIIGKEGNSASVVSDFSFGKFKFLDRLILHHGRWFVYRLSYFFVSFGLKNMVITWIIYFYAIQSAFSGSFNYTPLFYSMYNCFIAISQLVNFGLYGQDINDDQEKLIWDYLPEIYKQTKRKKLFSYKRYFIWSIISIVSAFFLYFVVRTGVSSLVACDADGRIADFQSNKIANGIVLTIFLLLLNYIDTQTHSSFYIGFVVVIMSILPTAGYFILENYLPFLSFYLVYTDNLNIRFWLTILAVISATLLVKLAYDSYQLEFNPSLVDTYKKIRTQPEDQVIETLDEVAGRPKRTEPMEQFLKQIVIEEGNPLELSMKEQLAMNRKVSASMEITSQSLIPILVVNKSAIISVV